MSADFSLSVLARATRADIVREPFPHLVLRDALEPSLFEQLEREYPDPALVTEKASPGVRQLWPAVSVMADDRVSELWRAFFAYHVSAGFWSDVVGLLGDELRRLHPGLEPALGARLEALRAGMRSAGRLPHATDGPSQARLECQYYLNCTREPGETARLRVDRPDELYKALLYLRDPRERVNTGAEVDICRERPGAGLFPAPHTIRVSGPSREIARRDVQVARTVRFEPNTLILLLNSARSLHAASVRSTAAWPRRHVLFTAELPGHALFRVDEPARIRLGRSLRRLPVIGSYLTGWIRRAIRPAPPRSCEPYTAWRFVTAR